MADYRTLAIKLISTNGKVDGHAIKLLRKSLFNEGGIAAADLEFLTDLRAALIAQKRKKTTAKFDSFYLKTLQHGIIGTGVVGADEVSRIEKVVLLDKSIKKAAKKKFLDGVKKKATMLAPEFDSLYEVMKK